MTDDRDLPDDDVPVDADQPVEPEHDESAHDESAHDENLPEEHDEPVPPSAEADPEPQDADEPAQDADAAADADEPAAGIAEHGEHEPDLATDVTATDREAAANEAAERERTVDGKHVGLWLTRAVAGLAVIAMSAFGIQHADGAAIVTTSPRAAVIMPASPAESRTCVGPLLRSGADDGTADVLSAVADPTLEATGSDLEQTELPIGSVDDAASVLLDGSDLSGAQIAEIDTDFAQGLAASECSEPATVQWLVGGATSTGRSTILTIANPSEHNVSVDVRIFGEEGEVEAAGSTGIAVTAGTTVAIDLAGLAPALTSPIVQVIAEGGPVSAHLQQSVVRGLVPGGIDVVDPVAAAATSIVVPGVRIEDATGIESTEGLEDAGPALRILAGTDTTATITTIGDDEEPIESTLELTGGVVSEIDLVGLATGTYSFEIEADVAIVAGVRQTVIEDDGVLDLDWVAAGQALPDAVTIAVPAGPGASLHLVNTTDAEQTYAIDGDEITIASNAHESVRIDAGVHELTGEGAVAAVRYVGDGQVAGFTVTPRGPADDGLSVVL